VRVIVLANRKGGSGRSTLTAHLAIAAHAAGQGPVAVCDLDPQGSLTAWANDREVGDVAVVEMQDTFEATVAYCRKHGIRTLFADTSPQTTRSVASVIACADLVLCPVQPSVHDLRAVGTTAEIARKAGRQLAFVLNRVTPRTRVGMDAAIALSEHGMVCPTVIHNRTVFASSMIAGLTAGETEPGSKSAGEIDALWAWVASRTTTKASHARTPT